MEKRKIPGPKLMPDEIDILSAQELVGSFAVRLTQWSKDVAQGRPFEVWSLLSGLIIIARSIKSEGNTCIQIDGELDGKPCMFMASTPAVQLLAVLTDPEAPLPKKREMGFHFREGVLEVSNKKRQTSEPKS